MAKKSKKQILSTAGETEDQPPKRVMSGVFTLVGTHGIPLEVVLDYFKKHDLVVDWIDYVTYALKDGAKLGTVKSRIETAVGECYGPTYKQEFMNRFNMWYP